jgi:hypothetical protein
MVNATKEAARLGELNDLLLGYFASWRMQVDKSKIEEVVQDLLAANILPAIFETLDMNQK